ncbi:MAG: hypothetical protein KKA55_03830 [Proteobacteria bacterium]|nr:hypothetical protein [Pseudomonadota bacterium]MBU1594643.1 hypothetical protein [Pseudomonadota bacterium]
MSVADTANTQLAQGPAGQRPLGVPSEPRLPVGKPLRSVQSQPLPLISQPEGPRPVLDEQAVRRQVAQARVEITGTGGIVDTIV